MRLPRNLGLCVDGSLKLRFADFYQLVDVEPGKVAAMRIARLDAEEFSPLSWDEAPHEFVDGGSWDGMHHLTPLDTQARQMLAIARAG